MTSPTITPSSRPTARGRYLGWLAITICVLVIYSRAGGFSFVQFDDQDYIYQNPTTLQGLNLHTLGWAFTTNAVANYHPLTWISFLLDVSLFGPAPGGFHLENLGWHLLNSILLFELLRRLTGALWPSLFSSLVFAVHPAHVESVAWVSERKDVLSTFWLLLVIWFYRTWIDRRSTVAYALMFACFALSLLAKQMGVSLPLLLLLLDRWPLDRRGIPLRQRYIEKLPLFVLAAAASLAVFVAQRSGGTVVAINDVTLLQRLGAVPVAYARYLQMSFWPAGLCAYYPYVKDYPPGLIAGSIALLLMITAAAIHFRKRKPWLIVGWLWFIIALLPVIGIVQVGGAAVADRYLYFPQIGLTIMLAWQVNDLKWQHNGAFKMITAAAAAAVVIALTTAAFVQTGYWRNTRTLFTRAITTINDNSFAHMQLARLDLQESDRPAAVHEYELASRLDPADFTPEYDLGNLLMDDPAAAVPHYQEALRRHPDEPHVLNNLAIAYIRQNDPGRAFAALQQAVAIDPRFIEARINLARLLERAGQTDSARQAYQDILKIDPANPTAAAAVARLK